jgi:hypothetical protein
MSPRPGNRVFKTTGWDQPPRDDDAVRLAFAPKAFHQSAAAGVNQAWRRSSEPICPKLRRLARRRPTQQGRPLTIAHRAKQRLPPSEAPAQAGLRHNRVRIISLFIIDLLATLVTRAHVWAVLAGVAAARRSPALRKELVGRLRRSWLSLFGDRWKRDAPIEISFVLPGTVADEHVSHKGEDMATLHKSPGSARQKLVIKATLRLRGASPRRVASPALHRKRSPFDV